MICIAWVSVHCCLRAQAFGSLLWCVSPLLALALGGEALSQGRVMTELRQILICRRNLTSPAADKHVEASSCFYAFTCSHVWHNKPGEINVRCRSSRSSSPALLNERTQVQCVDLAAQQWPPCPPRLRFFAGAGRRREAAVVRGLSSWLVSCRYSADLDRGSWASHNSPQAPSYQCIGDSRRFKVCVVAYDV